MGITEQSYPYKPVSGDDYADETISSTAKSDGTLKRRTRGKKEKEVDEGKKGWHETDWRHHINLPDREPPHKYNREGKAS